jgi:hypothetical protein
MKRTDSREHHLPEVDAELKDVRRRGKRRQPTRIQLHRQSRASEERHLRAQEEVDRCIERLVSEARGVELVHAIEKVRRLVGVSASIGVFVIAPDRERYDAINFPGQSEGQEDEVGPIKKLEVFPWAIQLGYRVKDVSPSDFSTAD